MSNTWTIEIDENLPSDGLCSDKEKKIVLQYFKDGDDLYLILIHEICHTAGGKAGHAEIWQSRLLRKADIALKKGMVNLSQMLREEQKKYHETPRTTANEVYGRIEDIMLDAPDLSYKNLIMVISREYGLYPDEFMLVFKRSEKVYEAAKKQNTHMREAEERFKKLFKEQGFHNKI